MFTTDRNRLQRHRAITRTTLRVPMSHDGARPTVCFATPAYGDDPDESITTHLNYNTKTSPLGQKLRQCNTGQGN